MPASTRLLTVLALLALLMLALQFRWGSWRASLWMLLVFMLLSWSHDLHGWAKSPMLSVRPALGYLGAYLLEIWALVLFATKVWPTWGK